MAPELPRAIRRVTFVLLALAALAVEIAANDGREVLPSVGLAAAWVGLAAALGRLVPRPDDARRRPPPWVLVLLVALAALPFVAEPLRRRWAGEGYPLELQLVGALRNLGLGLAACAGWLLCLRLACVVSLFLMLFSAAMTNHPAAMAVLGLYTAAGSVWLMAAYWGGLNSVLVNPSCVVAVEVQPGRARLPYGGLALLGLGLALAAALALLGPRRVAASLGELVPTSGGTGETDLFARSGVGDGPEEAAGDNALAAGMVETDRMIEDNNNSLIDAVNDLFGPPHKPNKDQQRMVAAGKAEVIEKHGHLPENRRPSRDFDTTRQSPRHDRAPGSRSPRGVFEVHGRTPLHVRLVAYGRYDHAERRWLEARKPGSGLFDPEGGDWMRVALLRQADGWYGRDERHRLKAADLRSNLVPTPALLTRFRINKVNSPAYYEWDYEGVLALAGRVRTPPGVVVATDSRTADPARLPAEAWGAFPAPELTEVPAELAEALGRIAREWAGDRPRGWGQVEAVIARLRGGYVHDRRAAAPAGHPAPVLWFLTESRRGPDYLFATAAALLLRALDYPARVCLGYYASPEAYDPETDHTPVKASDLHVWPEVRLRDGHWLVVEPTPGYFVLAPRRSLAERLWAALTAAGAWAWRHAAELAALLAGAGLAWWRRRELADAAAVRLWAWRPGRTWRERVRGAVGVLERRGRWAGQGRRPGQTVRAWLPADDDLGRLAALAEWAAYSEAPPPWHEDEVRAVCRRALDGWTLARWRAGGRA